MLKEFALKNFKALEDVSLSLGRITVLIGPNGTGKSSVLQALALLKQSRGRSALEISGDSINLGHYQDVVHRRQLERDIECHLLMTMSEPRILKTVGTLSYEARFREAGLRSHSLTVNIGGLAITGSLTRVVGLSLVRPAVVSLIDGVKVQLRATADITLPIQAGGWDIGQDVDESTREAAESAIQNVLTGLYQFLGNTYVVPAIRGFNKPAYPLQDYPGDDFLTVRGPDEQASSVLSTIAMSRELEEAISELAERAIEIKMRVKILPGKQVSAEAYDGAQTNLVNEGFGANQLMVLLAQLVVAPQDSLLGIEEPEIHLHPRAQAALADIFATLAIEENKQVLITTHNEHMLIGLLTQVAEGKLKPEELAVYYFSKEGPAAKAERLTVDEKGGLEGGLKGFFEVDIEQAERRLQALLKKSSS